jgi:glycosyltransferase involved in cell wall biosynthesis
VPLTLTWDSSGRFEVIEFSLPFTEKECFVMSNDICVIIPCLNEELTIEITLAEVREAIPSAYIIVIDNKSTDETAKRAAKLANLVVPQPLMGKANAFRKGIEYIPEESRYVVLIDGDATYSCKQILTAVSMIDNGFEMIIGNRITDDPDSYRPMHDLGNTIFTSSSKILFKMDIHDVLSGWRVMSKPFVESFHGNAGGFELETELNVHALVLRCAIGNVDVIYRARPIDSKSKLRTYRDGIKIVTSQLFLFARERPLFAFTSLSIPVFIMGISLAIRALGDFFSFGEVPKIPSLLMSTLSFSLSLGLITIGLLLKFQLATRVIMIQSIHRDSAIRMNNRIE